MVYKSKIVIEEKPKICFWYVNLITYLSVLLTFLTISYTFLFYKEYTNIPLLSYGIESALNPYQHYELSEVYAMSENLPYRIDSDELLDEVEASALLAFNPNTHSVYFQENSFTQLSIASITKLLTLIVAQDHFLDDDILVAGEYDLQYLEWFIGLKDGDTMTFEDVRTVLMISSFNDVAYLIADNYPGGYDAFVEEMNRRASEIGMESSRFANPAGLDDELQYSTAWDIKRLVKKAILYPEIVETASIYNSRVVVQKADGNSRTVNLTSTNKLLGTSRYMKGLKTGFTANAGPSFVSLYKYGDDDVLVTVLLGTKGDRFEETSEFVQYIRSARR